MAKSQLTTKIGKVHSCCRFTEIFTSLYEIHTEILTAKEFYFPLGILARFAQRFAWVPGILLPINDPGEIPTMTQARFWLLSQIMARLLPRVFNTAFKCLNCYLFELENYPNLLTGNCHKLSAFRFYRLYRRIQLARHVKPEGDNKNKIITKVVSTYIV